MSWTFVEEKKVKVKAGFLPFHLHSVRGAILNGIWLAEKCLRNEQ